MSQSDKQPGWLVIGLGNEYRGDDAVGVVVARRIKRKIGGARVVERRDASLLLEAWDAAANVIVVDAMRSGSACGTILRLDAVKDRLPAEWQSLSTHAVGLSEAIELARLANAMPERLVVYGIEGSRFESSQVITPEVDRAAWQVVGMIMREMTKQGDGVPT
jgi:hydrogenase maturation protease